MLSVEDAGQVLLDHTGNATGPRSQAEALAQRLGCLPLALRLAGRSLADAQAAPVVGTITTFEAYREIIERGEVEVLDSGSRSSGDSITNEQARQIIGSTWELSLKRLDDRGLRSARKLLLLLSMFGPAPIPYQALIAPPLLAAHPDFMAWCLTTFLN